MVAYSLLEKGDSVAARPYVDQYFAKADPKRSAFSLARVIAVLAIFGLFLPVF